MVAPLLLLWLSAVGVLLEEDLQEQKVEADAFATFDDRPEEATPEEPVEQVARPIKKRHCPLQREL